MTIMAQKAISSRIAEEAQLLAEEKWIIATLNKLTKQRNALQIERLQLESLKTQTKTDKSLGSVTKKTQNQEIEAINTVNLMQSSSTQNRNVPQIEEPPIWDSEGFNVEELNLSVTNPNFMTDVNSIDTMDFDNEEEEEEDDEEIYLDINMLMDAIKN